MAKLGEAFVSISTKDDKLKSGLAKAHGDVKTWADKTQKSIDSVGFGNFNKSALSALSSITLLGIGLTASLGKAASIGMEFENSYFQMSKTFQSKTSEMVAQAQSMAEQFKHYYDVTEISYAFTKSADSMERYGITGQKYLDLVARAADIGAAKNLALKESIDRIESAMRGEAEASEYLGLTLNDTYMKNKAFGGALQDVWEKLDDNTKAWYRNIEVMRQSVKYQGSASDATKTLSGALKSLGGTLKDELGPPLSVVDSYLAGMVNWMNQAIQSGGSLYNTVMFLSNGFKEMLGSAASSPTGGGGGWGDSGGLQGSTLVRKAIPKGTAFTPPPGGNKFLSKGGGKSGAGAGAGAGPITLSDIDMTIERIKDRAVSMNDEFESMTNELLQTIARNHGRSLDAELLEIERWSSKTNRAIWKDIEETQRAYDELMQKLGGKRGATPEARQAAVEAQAALERTWLMGLWSMDRAGELRGEKLDNARLVSSREIAEVTAQLRVDVTSINGSLQEQLDAQLALLEAEKQRELASASTVEQQTLIAQKYELQAKYADMLANGSYMDGFGQAMKEYHNGMINNYETGKEFFSIAEDGFRGIGSAINDAIRGTDDLSMAFANMITEMSNRLGDLVMDQAFQMMFGGLMNPGALGQTFGNYMPSGWTVPSSGLGYTPIKLAEGGIVTKPTLAWIGEGGKNEAVIPLPNGLGTPSFSSGGSSKPPNVTIKIENQTGQPIQAEQRGSSFDAEGYIVSVVAKNYDRGGALWKMIRGKK